MPAIITNLWFDREALEAAESYCSGPENRLGRRPSHADAPRAVAATTGEAR